MSASQRRIAALEAEVAQLRAHVKEAAQVIYLFMAASKTRHVNIPGEMFAKIPPNLKYETHRDPLNQDLQVRFIETAAKGTGLIGVDGAPISSEGLGSGLVKPA